MTTIRTIRTEGPIPKTIARVAALTLVGILFALNAHSAHAATFTVTNTNDSGTGSLRQAITDANNISAGADTINFNIPGAGPHTISPASSLPPITDPVTINGYSQPGSNANTLTVGNNAVLNVELDGSGAGRTTGLQIFGGSSVVKGLAINRFEEGIFICCDSTPGVRIEGNFIGTDPSGTLDRGNGTGVRISEPGHTIGGTTPAARNVISGNGRRGVLIGDADADATNNKVQGNYIGTDKNGTADLGNDLEGVSIGSASNNTVGGTVAGARNVISGNGTISPESTFDAGISIIFSGSTGNRVQGNYIGTDASGTQDLGNSGDGVDIYEAPNNTVGGTTAGAGNIISGNGFNGVSILSFSTTDDAAGNLVQGNYIGTDKNGTAPLGNTLDGVGISRTSSGITIGGTMSGARNVISGNDDGVAISGGTGNRILSNSIFSNTDLGIDLKGGTETAEGVTANDAGDADAGPNNLQNYPEITSARPIVKRIRGKRRPFTFIQGTLNSTPGQTFTVQLFSSPQADPSGNGEGQRFLGQRVVTTDGAGDASFGVSVARRLAPVGSVVTATATNDSTGDTSEFSAARTVQ